MNYTADPQAEDLYRNVSTTTQRLELADRCGPSSHQTCRCGIEASVVGESSVSGRARAVPGVGDNNAGLACPCSGSMIPRPPSVVSMPSAVPLRAPASGTKSMGRGLTPDRTRLFVVSSLKFG